MSDYRRAYSPGGHYFFTVVTYRRNRLFIDERHVIRLREAFHRTKEKHPFEIEAVVLMPDHLHTIWQLPDNDANFSLRWRLIKHYVATGVNVGVNKRGEKKVWQRRFWEHLIRDEEDWRNHMDYIHYNPVKHGYVNRPGDWPWSSFSRAVERGWYDENWGCSVPTSIGGMELE